MKRVLVLLAVLAAVSLLLPAAALADGSPVDRGFDGSASHDAARVKPTSSYRAARSVSPVADYVTLQGTVYDFDGNPQPWLPVAWLAWDDTQGWLSGNTETDANGFYSYANTAVAVADIASWTWSPDGSIDFGRFSATWSGDPAILDFRPGQLSASITEGGPWGGWSEVKINAWTTATDGHGGTNYAGTWLTERLRTR